MRLRAALVVVLVLFTGCAAAPEKKPSERPIVKSLFEIPVEVKKVEGNQITLQMEKPSLPKEPKLTLQLAQSVIDSCYVLEGKETLLNQVRIRVLRVAGNEVLAEIFDKAQPLKPGDRGKIFIQKKLIAVKDFEVIMGRNLEVAKYVQEDVTSALVESGYFNIVERLKLRTILDEIQLGQTGMIDPDYAKKAGKLLGADIILTGTLAAVGEEWNVNLRLVNTETGLIIAAIHRKGPLEELKTEAYREMKQIEGSFESEEPDLQGWFLGKAIGGRTGQGGSQTVYIDKREGANGTKRSLALKFKLGSKEDPRARARVIHAHLNNRLQRDLSRYQGIKFFIRASEEMTVMFVLMVARKGSEVIHWLRPIPVGTEWRRVQIPFVSLSLGSDRFEKPQSGQVLDTKFVENIEWLADSRHIPLGTEGTIWLDEVSFY